MKPAKLIVLAVAGASALGAAWIGSGVMKPKIIVREAPASAPQDPVSEVLVAAAEIPLGTLVSADKIRWQRWPKAAVSHLMLTRENSPNGLEDIAGSIARIALIEGEPVRKDKMIKGANAGFMSAILPSGMRAVAINIVSSGARTAGGFVLPNDRVDIIKVGRDEEASRAGRGDTFISDTILNNIRVLAIGQNIQERNGEKVVVGETATLELDPRQAEVITLAQRTGELSLVLRSMADISNKQEAPVNRDGSDMTIVRFGVSQTISKK
jgi:pilus assembly protein CpaB